MHISVNGHNVFLIVIVTFIASALMVPIIRKVAFHIGSIDKPNKRRLNKKNMPTLGGMAIFFAFLLGYMLYAKSLTQMLSILMGSILIIFIGIVDGINPVKAKYKLLVEAIASAIVVFYGQIYINELSFFGINLHFITPLNYICTIIFMLVIINAINLIDGLDGLSSGISSIYFLTIAIISFILNQAQGLDTILSLIMLGSTLGFLVYNFPPARIYMGDVGSLFLGFIISVIALLGFKNVTFTSLIVPLALLAIPLTDALLAFFRRLLKGEPIGKPDKEHLHHQLLKLNKSTTKTVLIIYLMNSIFALISILYVLKAAEVAIVLYILITIALIFIIIKTDILFEHKKKKR